MIVAHFGQLRFPEKETRFSPETVRRLLTTYPNLYYDISTGAPGRRYECNHNVLDTVLWQDRFGGQSDRLKPEYLALLSDFSTRFVAATDYGGGRDPLPEYLNRRVENLRRFLGQLPVEAQHSIGYRNAWQLLTGRPWAGTPSPWEPCIPVGLSVDSGAELTKSDGRVHHSRFIILDCLEAEP